MAYDEQLAERVESVVGTRSDITSKKMFGGIAFMLNGKMCCGIVGDDLMVRVGPDEFEDALSQPGARPMDFTGRPMKGMVYVDAGAIAGREQLEAWVDRGIDFAASLPPK